MASGVTVLVQQDTMLVQACAMHPEERALTSTALHDPGRGERCGCDPLVCHLAVGILAYT